MAKMICAKKHFGAGGKLVCVGTEADGKPDGNFWVAKDGGKTLEVATPKKPEPKPEPKE